MRKGTKTKPDAHNNMKTLEKKIQKMTAAIEALTAASQLCDVAGSFKHEYKTLELSDGKTIQVMTDETAAKVEDYLAARDEEKKAEKAAFKAAKAVAEEMGLELKNTKLYACGIKRLAERLVWRYEEAMAALHKVYSCDEFLRIPETETL